jgi:hypothetical protein
MSFLILFGIELASTVREHFKESSAKLLQRSREEIVHFFHLAV